MGVLPNDTKIKLLTPALNKLFFPVPILALVSVFHLGKISTFTSAILVLLSKLFVLSQREAGICQEHTPEGQEAEGPDDAGGRRKETERAVQRSGTIT